MARIKNSLAKAKDIRAGKSCFVLEWDRQGGFVVKKVVIREVWTTTSGGKFIFAGNYKAILGDRGVIGHAYDKRPTQIFNNRRSAQFWLDHYVQRMNQSGEPHFNFFVRGIHN